MALLVKRIISHKSGRQSYRYSIPAALRPFWGGKWEFKVSLGHEGSPGFHSRIEAADRECEDMIAKARRHLAGAFDPLDAPRIAYLAEVLRVSILADDEDARFALDERRMYAEARANPALANSVNWSLANSVNWSGDPVRRWAIKTRETVAGMLHLYRDLRAIGDLDGIVDLWREDALDLIAAEGLVTDPNADDDMARLCRALNDAAIAACEARLRRLDGEDVPTPPDPLPIPASAAPTRASATAVPLLAIYDRYAAAQGLTPGVRDEWRRYIQLLIDFLGHDDATQITTERLLEWRDRLLKEPTRKGTPRDPTTVRDKYITPTRATLGWAVEERLLPSNVAADVVVRVPKKAKLRDPDFTAAEAKTILKATLAPASANMASGHARARRWIPWLCAYTGARVNEFSQLRKEDVAEIDGIWVVRITPEAGTVKTNEARIVPIHEHLIEQGFIAMVQAQKEGPLFYEPGEQRVEGDSSRHFKKVGERLAAWVRKDVGITDPNLKPNHAWRHTFKSMSYLVGIEERLVDAIQGHAPKTIGRTYGRPQVRALANAIAKIPRYEIDDD